MILTGGANSVKEELHPVTDQLLARGLATFAFEGPGQGEYFATLLSPFVQVFVHAVSAVIDMLEGRPEIDSERIGICGRATSGLLVIRAAAQESASRQ